MQGVQLYILVGDEDSGSDTNQLIAAFLFPFTQRVNSSHRETMGNLRAIDVTITVICAQNFTGSDCTQCIRGLTGSMCNETDDCINVTCSVHGQCFWMEWIPSHVVVTQASLE